MKNKNKNCLDTLTYITTKHTSMAWNSELNVFKKIWLFGKISNKLPNGLFGTNIYKTPESCWY